MTPRIERTKAVNIAGSDATFIQSRLLEGVDRRCGARVDATFPLEYD